MHRAVQFLTSRASTPIPWSPKRLDTFTPDELHALEQLKLSDDALLSSMEGLKSFKENLKEQKVDIEKLEEEAETTKAT